MAGECIFCKIVKGEIPSAKVWEDDKFLAILDAFPNTKGMVLVMPKEHCDSYAFDMPEDEFIEFTKAAREVAKLLEKALGVKRVAMVMEGMGVNHAHYKLYPLHGLTDKNAIVVAEGTAYYEKYPGYVCTRLGEKADFGDLLELADSIRNSAGKV